MKRTRPTLEDFLFIGVTIALIATSAILLHYHLFSHNAILQGILYGSIGIFVAVTAILIYFFKKKKDRVKKVVSASPVECKLDLLRSQFIEYISFYGGEDKEKIIDEINEQFEGMYRMVADIQSELYKDDILCQIGKLFYNTTNANEAYEAITKQLFSTTDCTLVRQLTQALYDNTCMLKQRYNRPTASSEA